MYTWTRRPSPHTSAYVSIRLEHTSAYVSVVDEEAFSTTTRMIYYCFTTALLLHYYIPGRGGACWRPLPTQPLQCVLFLKRCICGDAREFSPKRRAPADVLRCECVCVCVCVCVSHTHHTQNLEEIKIEKYNTHNSATLQHLEIQGHLSVSSESES
jgi:hypothetical protein